MKFSIEFVFVYVGSKLPHVFIFNEVTWFFPSNVYLRESTNRAISYTPWWDERGWMSFAHIVFHDAAQYSFVFPFYCLLDIRKNKHVYLYDIVLSLGIFSLPFLGFFRSMSQYILFEWYRSNTSRIFFGSLYYLPVFFWSFFDL
jgi:hypothetical protein